MGAADRPRIAAIVLAAGLSQRMGGGNKLIATINGVPLVRHAALAAIGSGATSTLVVTGHRAREVHAALAGLDVTFVPNPDYAEGLSTSLRAGLAALPPDVDGAVVLLSDMPRVGAEMIGRLIAAYRPDGIVVATDDGRRGNPVLWARTFFAALAGVSGDAGGRQLIEANPDSIVPVEIGPAASLDIDDPAGLSAAGGHFP
jgi:molybdenum cofactor cytidylyltransferase